MKNFIRLSIASIFSLLVFAPAIVSAATSTVKVSSPFANSGNVANTRKFNLTVSAVSPEKTDSVSVTLYQNGISVATYSEDESTYGGSWTYNVNVPTDGNYTFLAKANDGSMDSTSVKVDTSAPAPVVFKGTVRKGNTYTVTFTNPAGGETTTVKIYSSTKPDFTADASTLVGSVTIAPGQTKSFSYTAPDSAQRYNAVQSVDSAGNTSSFTGDPNTTATSSAQTVATSSTNTGTSGQVQGSETDKKKDDKSATNNNSTDKKKADDKSSNDKVTWIILIVVIVGLAGAYVRYLRGEDDNNFWPKQKSGSTKKKK